MVDIATSDLDGAIAPKFTVPVPEPKLGSIKIPAPAVPKIHCKTTLNEWLVHQGLHSDNPVSLFAGAVEGLTKTGVKLARAHFTLPTLHPLYRATGTTWYPGEPMELQRFPHRVQATQTWLESPVRPLVEDNIEEQVYRLDRGEGHQYPMLKDLADRGMTGWFGIRIGFGDADVAAGLPGAVTTWATKRRGGFTRGDLRRIRNMIPTFGLALYRMSLLSVANNLMTAYVGQQAGQRILSGSIQRGEVEHMRAAILLADLRGFTRFTNTHLGSEVLELLNAYHSVVADAIERHGGEVFKFVGDGLLAVFPMTSGDQRTPARAAYQAALDARIDVAQLAMARRSAGMPTLDLDLALHAGEVEYGNVGSQSRLDFTVIGAAVNEVARMEGLCEPNGVDLVMSEEFCSLADADARPLGQFNLRGFDGQRTILTCALESA